jgi:hypothetical protein
VNQATGHMKAEAQKPKNEQDHKDCPKHGYSLRSAAKTPEIENPVSGGSGCLSQTTIY